MLTKELKKQKKGKRVEIKGEAKGLCENCTYLKTCLYCQEHDRNVVYCEEFDCGTPNNAHSKPRLKQTKAVPIKIKSQKEKKLKGLCIDCENRFSCKTCNVEGGVWHCEEYK